MNKDEIWEKIKNDKTEIYDGHSMFDMFLAITEVLEIKHFLELSPNDRNKVNGNAIFNLLRDSVLLRSENPKQIAQILGQEIINKLDNGHIFQLLYYFENKIQMAEILGQNNLNKLENDNIFVLLYSSNNLIEMAQILGQEIINKLSDRDIYNLLSSSENKIEMAQALGQEIINKLSDEQKKELGLL